MRHFKDFYYDGNDLNVPVGHKGIPRSNMPQIEDAEAFQNWLTMKGIKAEIEDIDFQKLSVGQGEVNKEKAFRILKNLRCGGCHPVLIVDEDDVIVDGYHRYVARMNQKKQPGTMKALKIMLSYSAAIEKAHEFNMENH